MLGFNSGGLVGLLLIVGVLFVLLIISRGIVCWYWKVNERLEEQRRTNELLQKLLDRDEIKDDETINV